MKHVNKVILCTMLASVVPFTAHAATFKDTENHWAASAIQYAVDHQITKGYEDGTFRPEQKVTEAEFLALLIRAYKPAGLNENPSKWTQPFYDFAKNMNYPLSDSPTKQITRQEVANIVTASQGFNYDEQGSVYYLLVNNLSKGKTSPTYDGYDPQGLLTRAEAIQFIKNLKEKGQSQLQARPVQAGSYSELFHNYAWKPGDIYVLSGSFIDTYQETEQDVTLTVPNITSYRYAAFYYNGKTKETLEPGKSYTFKKAPDTYIKLEAKRWFEETILESYEIYPSTGQVNIVKVNSGKSLSDLATIDAMKRGFGLTTTKTKTEE